MVTGKQRQMQAAWFVLTGAALLPTVRCAAAIQYDLIVLPQGVAAYGVDHGQVVGFGRSGAMEGATFWPMPQTPVFTGGTSFTGIAGNQVVSPTSLLFLWNGAAFTAIDLKPAGSTGAGLLATDGQHQGGSVSLGDVVHAALWNGTPGSFVDLNPPSWGDSAVTGVSEGLLAGYANGHAVAWVGASMKPVDLNPFNVTTASMATGVSHGQIVGEIAVNPAGAMHAGIWTRPTDAGFVDLNPAGATTSMLKGTNGTQQVGYYTLQQSVGGGLPPPDPHPAVWSSTANAQELPLPAAYPYGIAEAIDSDGNIVGGASTVAPTVPGQLNFQVALLWTPHRLPGDANFDGKVGFDDLVTVARNYGQNNPEFGWVDGDFLDEGRVGFDDLLMVARNYGSTAPTAAQLAQFTPAFRGDIERAFAQVPEPAELPMLSLAMCVLRRVRPC